MTQPRTQKPRPRNSKGRFISKALHAFGQVFSKKVSGKDETLLLEGQPGAPDKNTTRAKRK